MKKLLCTLALLVALSVPAFAGDIEIGGFTGPAPAGFTLQLISGFWQLISSI